MKLSKFLTSLRFMQDGEKKKEPKTKSVNEMLFGNVYWDNTKKDKKNKMCVENEKDI